MEDKVNREFVARQAPFSYMQVGVSVRYAFFFCGFYREQGEQMEKVEFRCASCGRLLAKTDGNTEIKCPRCGAINKYNAETGKIEFIPRSRQRVTASGLTFS